VPSNVALTGALGVVCPGVLGVIGSGAWGTSTAVCGVDVLAVE
jgi:hypothetical protein